MSYLSSGSWYMGGKSKAEDERQKAAPGIGPSEAVYPSEWLGWDGWVNPEPMQTTAQDSTTTR